MSTTPSNGIRQRKLQIPLTDPSTVRSSNPTNPLLTLPEDILSSDHQNIIVKPGDEVQQTPSPDPPDFWDEFFDSLILTVPFSFLFLMMDILVHKQYNRHPDASTYIEHLLTAVPTLGMIVFHTNRHSTHFLTIGGLTSASIFSGCRLIWLVNKASYMTTIAQAPAVGTLWILTIVQLPLSRAVLALIAVGIWSWWTEMKFKP